MNTPHENFLRTPLTSRDLALSAALVHIYSWKVCSSRKILYFSRSGIRY